MTLIPCCSTIIHLYFGHLNQRYSLLLYLRSYITSIQIYYFLAGCHLHTIHFIDIFFIHSIMTVSYFICIHMFSPYKFIAPWLVANSITPILPRSFTISIVFITRCWSRYAYIGTNTVSITGHRVRASTVVWARTRWIIVFWYTFFWPGKPEDGGGKRY